MDVKLAHVDLLLKKLSTKTKQKLDLGGFDVMSSKVDGIGKRYLYENLYRQLEEAKKKGEPTISLQVSKLNIISEYLEQVNFVTLLERWENVHDPALVSCIGRYYNYVRRNADHGVVMRSPVEIKEREGKIWFELRGPTWAYTGELRLRQGCLFVLMLAEGGKEIHHVYKLGTRERPNVLQGMFSGVSTVFEPISGRTVLIRVDEKIEHLKNIELEVDELKKSKEKEERRLGEYFTFYEHNNLKIKSVTTFTIDDLGVCK